MRPEDLKALMESGLFGAHQQTQFTKPSMTDLQTLVDGMSRFPGATINQGIEDSHGYRERETPGQTLRRDQRFLERRVDAVPNNLPDGQYYKQIDQISRDFDQSINRYNRGYVDDPEVDEQLMRTLEELKRRGL